MTDEHESPDVEDVRRLLAEARHTDPIPDDVAARMDTVLAGLVKAEPPVAPVVQITAHRRTKVAGWLLAAAAVVVGGVVVAPHLSSGGSSSSATAGGAEATDGLGFNTGNTGDSANPGKTSGNVQAPRVHRDRVVVRPHHFSADAQATQRKLLMGVNSFNFAPLTSCADVPAGLDAVAAEYRRAPAALVFRSPGDRGQVVELYVCGRPGPVRSTTLPVP